VVLMLSGGEALENYASRNFLAACHKAGAKND
jgi:hypothetical protein